MTFHHYKTSLEYGLKAAQSTSIIGIRVRLLRVLGSTIGLLVRDCHNSSSMLEGINWEWID